MQAINEPIQAMMPQRCERRQSSTGQSIESNMAISTAMGVTSCFCVNGSPKLKQRFC